MLREMLSRAEAAQQRMLKARDQTARPSQRSASYSGAPRLWIPPQRAACTVERAAAGSATPDALRFRGMASVTGQGYVMYDYYGEYTETVEVGAFQETLAADPDTPLVISHDSMRRIARTGNDVSPLLLTEVTDGDETGLETVAPTLPSQDLDVQYIVPKLNAGLINEMSFRFLILAGRWNDEFTNYTIQRVDINRGDTSIVGYGANPLTAGSGLVNESQAKPGDVRAAFDRLSTSEALRRVS